MNVNTITKPLEESVFGDPENTLHRLTKLKENKRELIEATHSTNTIEANWVITDSFKKPLSNVHVICTPISTDLIINWLSLEEEGQDPKPLLHETFTNNEGRFDFSYLDPDQYFIRAEAIGWSPAIGILDLRKGNPDTFCAVMTKEKRIRGKVWIAINSRLKKLLPTAIFHPLFQ